MKTSKLRNRARLSRLAVLLLPWCGAAAAQTAASDTDTSQEAKELDRIVVTAERRERPLQKTPIAATVLSGEDMQKWGVNVIDQIQFATPSATVNNFGQGIDFNIRGIGKAEHNTQTTTGVITYRDGVATFPGYITGEPFVDIASVEVLRGPQGTFGGQNATGGAVFVTTNDPVIDGGHHGYVQGQIGNYNNLAVQGAVNLPISDTLAARVTTYAENRDSFWKMSGPRPDQDARLRTHGLRLGLLWKPNGSFSALWKTDYGHLDFGAYPADPYYATNDLFDITANADQKARDEFVRSVLKLEYEWDNGVMLRSVSGYQDGNTVYRADLDGTSSADWIFRDDVDERIYSQEINLISPDQGRFSWIAGAYWQKDKYTFPPGEFLIATPAGVATEYWLQGTNPKKTVAAFGQVGFDLTDRLQLEIGGRYSESETANDLFVLQYGLPIEQRQSAKYDNFSGKVALNWDVSDAHFLYAFYATGFRPGGLNVPVGLGLPDPFDEEKVKSAEIGWKAIWADGHVRTQINAFHNDYEGFQVIIGYPDFPTFGIQMNSQDTTTISGFEAQVQAYLGDWQIDANVGVMESKLGTFFAVDPRYDPAIPFPCDPHTGPANAAGNCVALGGRDQTYAPDVTYNIGVQRTFQLGKGTLTPRLNFSHVSDQWATLFQNEALGDHIEERNIFSGQIAWQSGDYVVTLYGTNLTDEHYVSAMNSLLRFAGPPRQYGLRVMKMF
ncbi:MAG: TonB-dependent receptor [Pseudoxanthomonas sp.]